MKARADDDGLRLSPRLAGSFDVLFDGEAIWSVTLPGGRRRGRPVLVRWPQAMRPWLQGRAEVALRPSVSDGSESADIPIGEVSLGTGEGRIRFVDKAGLSVVIDKWGIVQRPFSSRGDAVTAELGARTAEVIEVLREDCGLNAWIAFGTLLGAARAGKAIGHDSDSDLLYLSEHESPVMINLESYRIKRALSDRGMKAVIKAGSFVTVLFPGSDGAPIGIDIYACFYVDGLLHETATVRAPIPREAILPLGSLEFEGLRLPAPARPEALLEASYGPNWKVPDPSFRHRPGAEITQRFDGWFGNLMTNRRAWEMWWRGRQDLSVASALAERVLTDNPSPVSLIEFGSGNGSDAVRFAEAGHTVQAFDYARHSFKAAKALTRHQDLNLQFGFTNFYDLRDALSIAALQRYRSHPPEVLVAASLLDALQPRGRDAFWRLARTILRGGGRLYLQFDEPADATGRYTNSAESGPPRYAVWLADVRNQIARFGGRTVLAEQVATLDRDAHNPARHRWHVVAEWS